MHAVFIRTTFLLLASNLLMTVAWYGHLGGRYKNKPLWIVIPVAWGIAFFEYCLAVPANRWAYGVLSAVQLKILQEVLTLVVFLGFAALYLKEPIRWNHAVSIGLVLLAVVFAFAFKGASS